MSWSDVGQKAQSGEVPVTPPPPAQLSRHQQGKPRAGFAHGQFHLSHFFASLSPSLSLRPLHSSSSSSIHLSGCPQPSDSCLVAPWAPGKTPLSSPSLPALSAPVLSSVPLQVIEAFFSLSFCFFSLGFLGCIAGWMLPAWILTRFPVFPSREIRTWVAAWLHNLPLNAIIADSDSPSSFGPCYLPSARGNEKRVSQCGAYLPWFILISSPHTHAHTQAECTGSGFGSLAHRKVTVVLEHSHRVEWRVAHGHSGSQMWSIEAGSDDKREVCQWATLARSSPEITDEWCAALWSRNHSLVKRLCCVRAALSNMWPAVGKSFIVMNNC